MSRMVAGARRSIKSWGRKMGSKTMLGGTALALAGLATSSLASAQREAQPAQPAPRPSLASDPLTPDAPPPAPIWTAGDAMVLLNYISAVGKEGLNPLDYDIVGLKTAIESGNVVAMNKAATYRFNRLAKDLALGRIAPSARKDWHIEDHDLPDARLRTLLDEALRAHNLIGTLDSLLPTHPQYAALKNALAAARMDPLRSGEIDAIRLNMDRWRWLPRELGDKYIIVNVPSFHATLVENGKVRWKERAIAGKIQTPTPMLTAMASGVVINPWWEIPQSISKEVAGKPGYEVVRREDGSILRYRQPPGPNNALGVMKFVMLNPYAIYLHDTNARSRFNSEVRALSHGCIRTQHITDLATELLSDDGGDWDEAKMRQAIASKKTMTAKFVKPLPVHIVYFSKAATVDGKLVSYEDVYKRDAAMITALNAEDRGIAAIKAKRAADAAAKRAREEAAKPKPAPAPAPAPEPQTEPTVAPPAVTPTEAPAPAEPQASGGTLTVRTGE